MTRHDDFDRTLAGWFEADALPAAPAGDLERVIDATSRRRPLPAWLARPGSRWIGEAPSGSESGLRLARVTMTWSTAVILLLLAALIGGVIVLGARLLHDRSPLPTGRLGSIAYELDGDIFVASWDGTNPVRIADGGPDTGPPRYLYPTWSPDGQHLAYRMWEGDAFDGTIVISDRKGQTITSVPASGWNVAWSPDSARIATWIELGKVIGLYGADGIRQKVMELPPGTAVHGDDDPYWSPDGGSLLLLLGMQNGENATPSRIWELPLDDRPPRVLPDNDARQLRAAFSSDGARYALWNQPDSTSLVIADADGAEVRVMPGAPMGPCSGRGPCGPQEGAVYESPVWSPIGDRVAVTWSWSEAGAFYDKDGYASPRPHDLEVVDVATGTVTKLATKAAEIHAIAFSPEGDRILFSRTDDNRTQLWSVNVDGSHARLLVSGADSAAWQRLPADH